MQRAILEDANFYQYPTEIAETHEGSHVVVGDLDARLPRQLYFLVREGILDITPEQYDVLININQLDVDVITRNDINTFIDIILQVKIKQPTPSITFIGDDLCDRGEYEFLILIIFRKLACEGVNFEILHSNHGAQFLRQFFYGLNEDNITKYTDNHAEFGQSLINTQRLIQRSVIGLNEITQMINDVYLPRLKLLSTIVEENKLILLTHAPVTESAISRVAKLCGIEYVNHPQEAVIEMADKINKVMEILLKTPLDETDEKDLHSLAVLTGVINRTDEVRDYEDLISRINSRFNSEKSSIDISASKFKEDWTYKSKFPELECFVSDRYDDLVLKPKNPFSGGIPVTNVHGHDGNSELDQVLGEKWKYSNLDTQWYNVYKVYTDNTTYKKVELKKEVVLKEGEGKVSIVGTFKDASQQINNAEPIKPNEPQKKPNPN